MSENKNQTIIISFTCLEPNWPFLDFKTNVSILTNFLILEEQLKKRHGCIKNLKLFYDSDKKTQLSYHYDQKIGQKINSCQKAIINLTSSQQKQVVIFYQFQNGYEWPLLSF